MGNLNVTLAQANQVFDGGAQHIAAHRVMGMTTNVLLGAGGADPTGVADSSAAFNAAATALGSTGGTVIVPPGTFKIGNVSLANNVTFRGQGSGATNIITNGLDHAFKAPAGALSGGGVIGFKATGNGSSNTAFDGTVDFVNLAAATTASGFLMANNQVEKWRNAYYGSLDDRDPRIQDNNLWYNNAGVWVVANHPYLTGMNDIRANNYGLTGITLYDMNTTGQKFAYNNYNIAAQSGGSIQNCCFTGCTIAFGVIVGAQLGSGCSVNGGFLLAPSTGTADKGIEAVGLGGLKVNNVIVQSFGVPFTTGAICINAASSMNDISYNSFAGSGSSIGKGIVIQTGCNNSTFNGNSFRVQAATDQLMVKAGTDSFNYNTISNNTVSGGTTSSATIISINASNTAGAMFTGNQFFLAASSTSVAIASGIANGWAKGNISRNAGGNFSFTGATTNTNGMTVGTVANTDNIYF